jgi:hypothetical protein
MSNILIDGLDYGPAPDWGVEAWPDSTGTTANNGPQVLRNDVIGNATVSQGQDKWTGFFQSVVGDVAKYAIARDAAKNGMVPQTAANGQPMYVTPNSALRVGNTAVSGWLVIGAAVVAAVMLTRKG